MADVCNSFLSFKNSMVSSGELSERSFHDYRKTAERLTKFFGRGTPVEELTPISFQDLRSSIAQTYGPTRLSTEVQRVRIIMRYAHESTMVPVPVAMGPNFKAAKKKVKREQRQKRPMRFLSAERMRLLMLNAPLQLRCLILLAMNCGFGQSDLARLTRSAIDLKTGWIKFPRPKTSVDRRIPLWPETIRLLEVVLPKRPETDDPNLEPLAFLTKKKRPLVHFVTKTGSPVDSVGQAFGKLLRKLEIKDEGVNFYAIRHTFETVAGDTKDKDAIDALMGHAEMPDDMSAAYLEFVPDERKRAVVDHIRKWLGIGEIDILADCRR